MPSLQGQILTPNGFELGSIEFEAFIQDIQSQEIDSEQYILPGFIDVHVHGGGGADTMDGAEGVRTLAKFHLQHGSTTLYPTTITNPWQAILNALEGVKSIMEEGSNELPDIPGVHLEGPFISPDRLGAQPPYALEPNEHLVKELLEYSVIKLVTVAPEVAAVRETAGLFLEAGVQISVGHTRASFEEVARLDKFVRDANRHLGFTHLYNAMGGLSGRSPCVVGAALSNVSAYAELIFDTEHVHPASFLSALRAKQDKLILITDAMRAAGIKEGRSELGGQEVFISQGRAELQDGTLAGSLLTLDQALRNAVEAGLSVEQASHLLSRNPANYMKLKDRGELSLQKRADIVVLSKDLHVKQVYLKGQKVVG